LLDKFYFLAAKVGNNHEISTLMLNKFHFGDKELKNIRNFAP